jgi:hypothetical protein
METGSKKIACATMEKKEGHMDEQLSGTWICSICAQSEKNQSNTRWE